MLYRIISTKTKKNRKSWSAPLTVITLIVMGMLLVFIFELIGLTSRESNLSYRVIEKGIQSKIKYTNLIDLPLVKKPISIQAKAKSLEEVNKQNAIHKINRILLNSVNENLDEISFTDI